MIDFYQERVEDRDRFEILAFHDGSVKSFEELDEKLESIKSITVEHETEIVATGQSRKAAPP